MNNRRTFLATGSALAAWAACEKSAVAAAPPTPIRIGQIGTKHPHAAGKLEAILKYPEWFEFVGVVEPDLQRRRAVEEKAPYAGVDFISEADLFATEGLRAVAVETDVIELVPTAMRCLNAGMHIHLDKPAGESLQACRAMHRLAAEKQCTIQMGYMLRYNPAFQFAHRIVRAGWLGEITEINGMMGKLMPDAGRADLARFRGGGMFELACHLIDSVVWMLGPPDRVTAFKRRVFPDKDHFYDNQLAVLEYPSALATIRCNHVDPLGGPRRQFSITGTRGTLEIRPLEPQPSARLGLDRPRDGYRKGFQDIAFEKPSGRYDAEFIDLASVIRGETSLQWDAGHDIAVQEAVLRASGMIGD
jgi:predicted dehydrogenase